MANFGQIESENSVSFSLPRFENYRVNFLIKLDPTWKFNWKIDYWEFKFDNKSSKLLPFLVEIMFW
jgi:hypothetical protein